MNASLPWRPDGIRHSPLLPRRLRGLSLAVLAASLAAPAAAQEEPAAGAAGEGGLTATVRIMHQAGEGERPEPRASYVLGEGFFVTFWVKGHGTTPQGAPKLKGTWELLRPDGTPLPLEDAAVAATSGKEAGPDGVLLRPVPGLKLRPQDAPGLYTAKVTVTDAIGGGTCSAEAPIFMFLTPAARDLVTAPTPKAPRALDTTLLAPGFWSMSLDDFLASTWIHSFNWTSEARDEVVSRLPGVTFLGEPLVETKVRFADGRPVEVKLFFYNRGDAGLQQFDTFTASAERLTERLKRGAGVPQNLSPTSGKSVNQKQTILVWKRDPTVYRLDYAWTVLRDERTGKTMQPEYISMALLPAQQARTRGEMAGTQQASVSTMSLRGRVKRLPNGDVYIDGIPMVDQGEKGYCAAAATERILDYYGTDVDQHELAQRMLMATGGGATYESIERGLRALAATLKVQMKVLQEQDDKAFARLIEDYNEAAAKAGLPPVGPGRKVDPNYASGGNIWSQFDKDLFLKTRAGERVAIEKFLKKIQEKIDLGIPVCQCCIIGILPEEAKIEQEPGGHMRIVIGYNLKTREILYTDSWGPGHELKRLGLGETFAITTGLFTLEPR